MQLYVRPAVSSDDSTQSRWSAVAAMLRQAGADGQTSSITFCVLGLLLGLLAAVFLLASSGQAGSELATYLLTHPWLGLLVAVALGSLFGSLLWRGLFAWQLGYVRDALRAARLAGMLCGEYLDEWLYWDGLRPRIHLARSYWSQRSTGENKLLKTYQQLAGSSGIAPFPSAGVFLGLSCGIILCALILWWIWFREPGAEPSDAQNILGLGIFSLGLLGLCVWPIIYASANCALLNALAEMIEDGSAVPAAPEEEPAQLRDTSGTGWS